MIGLPPGSGAHAPLQTGLARTRIGRYAVIRRLPALDREVYLASEQGNERLIVLVPDDAEGASLIEDEVRRARLVQHRAIVPVLEMSEEDGRRMLVFEHLAGATLTQLGEDLKKRGELLSEVSVWHIGYECASALAAAHGVKDAPVLHGHLKPDHVVITWEGGIRLLGLGLASVMGAHDDARVPAFCAPEVRAGEQPGPSADAYALAAILWWLLMGRLPPLEGPIPRVTGLGRDVPLAVGVALQRALSPSSEKRIDCRRLASALQRPARRGQVELAWNMEMLRALSANDPVPSSKAFRSAASTSTQEPPASVDAVPRAAESIAPLGTPVSRVALIDHAARAQAHGDSEEAASFDDTTEDTADILPTGERHLQQESNAEDREPTNPRYLSQPAPAVAEEDNEPTTNYQRTVAKARREDTEVVPPDVLRRETEADAAATRKQRWQKLLGPRTLMVLACLFAAIAIERWLASPEAPAEPTPESQTQRASLPPPAAVSAGPSGSAREKETLPPNMGYLTVATDLSADDAGVYVFGDYFGRVNERLSVPCGRVFVRLGTRPPQGGPGRRWLSPGHTTQVVCGAVTIVTVEPYPRTQRVPVAARRPPADSPSRVPNAPARPTPGSAWLPDDL